MLEASDLPLTQITRRDVARIFGAKSLAMTSPEGGVSRPITTPSESASLPLAPTGREGRMGMIGVDRIGDLRRVYFDQDRSIKEIVRRDVQPTRKFGFWVDALTARLFSRDPETGARRPRQGVPVLRRGLSAIGRPLGRPSK